MGCVILETERTFVAIKPDGVQRGIIGDCITRFERCGLKLVAMKMVQPSKEFVAKHYPSNEGWLRSVGNKTVSFYKEHNLDVAKDMGCSDDLSIGKKVKEWLCEYLSSGPVVAMIWEGHCAIDIIRKHCGNTLPTLAAPGTIRGDYSIDSSYLANVRKRPIRNIMHASGNKGEAENEIGLWFKPNEIYAYKRADEKAMFG